MGRLPVGFCLGECHLAGVLGSFLCCWQSVYCIFKGSLTKGNSEGLNWEASEVCSEGETERGRGKGEGGREREGANVP